MTAYLLNIVRGITDVKDMETYWNGARSTYSGQGKVLAAYTPFEVLEGDDVPMWGIVLQEWPSMESAREWYDGDAYQALKKHREGVQDNICVLVEGGWVPMQERKAPAGYIG